MSKCCQFILSLFLVGLCIQCQERDEFFAVRGRLVDKFGNPMSEVAIIVNDKDTLYSNLEGYFNATRLVGETNLRPLDSSYEFEPAQLKVTHHRIDLQFKGLPRITAEEALLINWFLQIPQVNGLVPSMEHGDVISLYDNALASLVYMMIGEYDRAEAIFDFFDQRTSTELTNGLGGFSQFRSKSGVPTKHRWLGDNAWLLLALHNYKVLTGSNKYVALSSQLEGWLISLQDSDGGFFSGYDAHDQLLNYKVTEGMIDAFATIPGYTTVHEGILSYLGKFRWSEIHTSLISWPENSQYTYALDLHPWSFLIFSDFPNATLTFANRFVNTQILMNGKSVTGYCFDDDRDVVWLEGTAQMCLALGKARMHREKRFYLNQILRSLIPSVELDFCGGFPYASNMATSYGSDLLWNGANTKPCVSTGAWYLFAKWNFNPFEIARTKSIPDSDKFW